MRSDVLCLARNVALCVWVAVMGCPAANAVTSGGKSEQAPPGDDYADGKAAFEREDWLAVIDHMVRVIEERPWHDDAHNLMGFAYRKLGDYDKALAAYDRALDLNPHHRGAMEYLGEAYLELDQPDLAKDMLDRLAAECRRIAVNAANGTDWRSDCEEWQDLDEAYRAYFATHSGE